MNRYGLPRGESWIFTDPITGNHCSLIIEPGGKPGVRHPGCPVMATVIAELDAFYCLGCHHNGRISGRWAVDIITARTTPTSGR